MASIHFLAFKRALALGVALFCATLSASAQEGVRYYPLSENDFYLELGTKRFYLVLDPMWRAEPESKSPALKKELKARNLPDESVMVSTLSKGTAKAVKLRLEGELAVDASKEREIKLTYTPTVATSSPIDLLLQKTGEDWQAEDPLAVDDLAKALQIKKDVLILRLANSDGKMTETALWNRLGKRLKEEPNFVLITQKDGIVWVHTGASPEKQPPTNTTPTKPEKTDVPKDAAKQADWLPWALAGGGGLVVGFGTAFFLKRDRKPKVAPVSPNLLKLTEFVQGQVDKVANQNSDRNALEKAAVAEMLDRYAKYGEVSAENQRLQQYKQFQDNFDRNVKIVEQHKTEKEAIEAQMRRIQAEKDQAEKLLSAMKSEQRGTENQIEALRVENRAAMDVVEQSEKLLARYEELLKQFGDSMADELGKSSIKK